MTGYAAPFGKRVQKLESEIVEAKLFHFNFTRGIIDWKLKPFDSTTTMSVNEYEFFWNMSKFVLFA